MSNSTNNFELSRRKVLAGLSSVGVASAGAGLGTTAFLSDEESFDGNRLVAGELDLVVDFQEQYSDRGQDEFDAVTNAGGELRLVNPDGTDASDLDASELGIPSQNNPMVVIDTDENTTSSGFRRAPVTAFQEATAIDAFPDTSDNGTEDDGVQDDIPINSGTGDDSAECNYLQPLVPQDGDILSADARTTGTANSSAGPNAQTTNSGDPLVDIEDIKPGDFGEVTFSLHLCGNPGYISLTGQLDEQQSDQILLEKAQGVIWYDAGDNGEFDDTDAEPNEGDNILEEDVEEVVGEPGNTIFRGSLDSVLDLLQDDPGIPLDGDLSTEFSEVVPVGSDIDTLQGTGDFDNELGPSDIDIGTGTIDCKDINGDYSESVKFEADELRDYHEALQDSDDDFTGAIGIEEDGSVIEIAGEPSTDQIPIIIEDIQLDTSPDPPEVQSVTISTDQGATIDGASLDREPIKAVVVKGGSSQGSGNSGPGFVAYEETDGAYLDSVTFDNSAIDDKGISFIEICYEAEPGDPGEREPFPNSTTAFIGFAWYLPYDVHNEVANTSLTFDIGFQAEQARNNDDPSI